MVNLGEETKKNKKAIEELRYVQINNDFVPANRHNLLLGLFPSGTEGYHMSQKLSDAQEAGQVLAPDDLVAIYCPAAAVTAIDYLKVENADALTDVILSPDGGSANKDLQLKGKGTGDVKLGSDLDLNSNELLKATIIRDVNGNEEIVFVATGSATDYFKLTNATGGAAIKLEPDGSETNVGVDIIGKGTGRLQFATSGQILINAVGSSDVSLGSTSGKITSTAGDDIDLTSTGGDITLTVGGAKDILMAGSQVWGGNVDATGKSITDLLSVTSTGDFTLDVSGDIILDADGADIILKDAGSEFGRLTNSSGLVIDNLVKVTHDGGDVVFEMSGAGNAVHVSTDASAGNPAFIVYGDRDVANNVLFRVYANGAITVDTGNMTFANALDLRWLDSGATGRQIVTVTAGDACIIGDDNLSTTIKGSTITLDSPGDITLDADGGDWIFKDGGTEIFRFTNTSSDCVLNMTTANKTFVLADPVYDDFNMGVISGRIPGADYPSLETFTTNTQAYAFAVSPNPEFIYLEPKEVPHDYKNGTDFLPHVHIALNAAQSSGSSQYVKFELFYAEATSGGTFSESSVVGEVEIPNGSSDLQEFYVDLADITGTNFTIGDQMVCTLKRIAATGGTELAQEPFALSVGFHYQIDTMGSRQERTK
jgi:hypothetical protein